MSNKGQTRAVDRPCLVAISSIVFMLDGAGWICSRNGSCQNLQACHAKTKKSVWTCVPVLAPDKAGVPQSPWPPHLESFVFQLMSLASPGVRRCCGLRAASSARLHCHCQLPVPCRLWPGGRLGLWPICRFQRCRDRAQAMGTRCGSGQRNLGASWSQPDLLGALAGAAVIVAECWFA